MMDLLSNLGEGFRQYDERINAEVHFSREEEGENSAFRIENLPVPSTYSIVSSRKGATASNLSIFILSLSKSRTYHSCANVPTRATSKRLEMAA
jgi:hypothetical protein